ncbi:MAG TPA: phosphate ABC transporter substrate-binding protein PstS [Chloroflexota bacterium]
MQSKSRGARLATVVAAVVVASSLVAATATPNVQARTKAASTLFLNGAGSTFVYPLMLKWAFTYGNTISKTTRINYQSIGSGAGIAQFTAGTVDFGATDGPMTDAQIQKAGGDVLHIPVTLGPEAVIYNLPSVHAQVKLDGPTLARIYQGKITKWDDKAIAALNSGVQLPSIPIVVAHRSDGSGTTFIFASYLSAVSADWKSNVGASTTINWPTGEGGRGNAGVAAIVKQSPGGIGYVELSYAISTQQTDAMMKNKAGVFVAPSTAGASADAANAGTVPSDLRAIIVDSPGKDSYPISGFSWALIHQKAPDAVRYGALLNFLWWVIHRGQSYASSGSLRYAPLASNIVKLDEAKIKSVTYRGKPLFTGK